MQRWRGIISFTEGSGYSYLLQKFMEREGREGSSCRETDKQMLLLVSVLSRPSVGFRVTRLTTTVKCPSCCCYFNRLEREAGSPLVCMGDNIAASLHPLWSWAQGKLTIRDRPYRGGKTAEKHQLNYIMATEILQFCMYTRWLILKSHRKQ